MATSQKDAVAYHNGKVFTLSNTQPHAEAFIVSPDGTFDTVGSNKEILDIAQRDKLLTYDLNGHFIFPGFHDAHVHILYAGLSRLSNYKPGMDATNSNVAERMKSSSCACEYAHTYGNWLVGDLYRIENFDRASLDEDFPDTPIVLRGGAGHALFANTAALEQSGYSIDSEPDQHGHQYFRDSNGKLTGEMAELAMSKMFLSLPKPPPSHIKRCLLKAISVLHRAGVTSCQEASANTVLLTALQSLEKSHSLKMDIQTHIVHCPEYLAEETYSTLRPLIDNSSSFSSAHVHTNFVKIMLDGVPLAPYYTHAGLVDDKDSTSVPDHSKIQLPAADLLAAITKYDAEGKTVKVHCTGHGSTRLTLQTIAAVRNQDSHADGTGGTRHEIAHCSGVHSDDYALFARHNVTAEMSPSMFFVHPLTQASEGLMDWNFPRMLQSKAHLTVGSDWSFQDSPDLLPACAAVMPYIAEYFGQSEGVGSEEAKRKAARCLVRMLTLGGAEAVGREKVTGSIEKGKKANFVMVDRDLAEGNFEGATVERTWFEGELVWDARERRSG